MANTIKPSAGNPIKLFNSSLEGVTVTDDGDVQVKLGDAAGVKKLSIRDSGDVEVAYIDSDGVISGASGELPTAVQGSVLIGDATPEWAVLDASADTKILVGNGTTLTSVALSGDITMTNAGVITIANDAVTLVKLANVTRGSLIVGGASDAPTLLSGKTLGAIPIGDGTDITSTINPSIAGNVGIGGTLTVTGKSYFSDFIGIGESSPTNSLHITRNATNNNGFINFEGDSSASYGVLGFTMNEGATPIGTMQFRCSGVASPNLIKFGALDAVTKLIFITNSLDRVLIDSSGNVGIGTATPVVKLHVYDTANLVSRVEANSSSAFAGLGIQADDANINLSLQVYGGSFAGTQFGVTRADTSTIFANSGLLSIGTKGASDFLLGTNNIERMRIDSSGNVGISETTIPTGAKLAVGGGIAVTNGAGTPKIQLSQLSGNNLISCGTADGSDSERLRLAGGGAASHNQGAYINLMGNEYSTQEGDLALLAGYTSVSGKIRFFTGNATERMRIAYDGGIIMYDLPTSDPGVEGQLWNSGGTLKVSAG